MLLDILLWPFLQVYKLFSGIINVLTPKKKPVKESVTINKYNNAKEVKKDKKIRFKYVVKDKDKKIINGFFDAYKKINVESYLVSQGYEIIEVREDKFSTSLGLVALSSGKKMKYKELAFFLTQLSTYIKAGIPLTDAMIILSKQAKKKSNKLLYQKIVYELNSGVKFSESLARQDDVFPRLLINMAKTSELTGNLTEILDDLAAYYTSSDNNRKQIVGALTYPSVIFIVAISILAFIMMYVVPKFTEIYAQIGTELPGITQAIINISDYISINFFKILAVFAVVIIIFVIMLKNLVSFRYTVQWLCMHIPVVKNIIIYKELIMFTKTFASLINHDVFITDSMEILGKITNNEIYKMLIKDAVINLSNGDGIAPAFKGHWAFPSVAYEMLLTGERTGKLGSMMENVSVYYEGEQKVLIEQLKSLIEPVMIVLLAVVVGIMLIAVVVPMFDMYGGIV